MQPKIQEITKYERGTNPILDKIYDETTDGPLWIIQGSTGRRPVLAGSEAEAKERYINENNPAFL